MPGDEAGTQKVTFVSTTDKHKKDDLVKSLGKKAETYVVKEVKVEPCKDGEKDELTAVADKEATYIARMTGVT